MQAVEVLLQTLLGGLAGVDARSASGSRPVALLLIVRALQAEETQAVPARAGDDLGRSRRASCRAGPDSESHPPAPPPRGGRPSARAPASEPGFRTGPGVGVRRPAAENFAASPPALRFSGAAQVAERLGLDPVGEEARAMRSRRAQCRRRRPKRRRHAARSAGSRVRRALAPPRICGPRQPLGSRSTAAAIGRSPWRRFCRRGPRRSSRW